MGAIRKIVQILINDETLDVTMEKERNLGEVYDFLCNWMKEAGMYPLALRLDSQETNLLQGSHWKERLIDDVNCFNLRAGSINQLQQQQMMTIIDYLLLLQQLIARIQRGEQVEKEFANAYAEYGHVRSALPQIVRLNEENFAEDFKLLDQSVAEMERGGKNPPELLKFNENLEQLRSILLDRLYETAYPIQAMKNAAAILKDILPTLAEAGIFLQTGNERDAYGLVFKISEMIAKSIRIMEILSIEYPQNPFNELRENIRKLVTIIDEINETMKNKDSVMLADILEYDLHEQLRIVVEQIFLLDSEAV